MEGDTVHMSDSFTTYLNALHNVFWGLLGMSDPDSAEILTFSSNSSPNNDNDSEVAGSESNSLYITETTGKTLWISKG